MNKQQDKTPSLFGQPATPDAPPRMPKLSREALAIIHAHMPPPDIDRILRDAGYSQNRAASTTEESPSAELNDERITSAHWLGQGGLPLYEPLASALSAAAFGRTEDGAPVHPSREEIESIVHREREKLTELLGLEGAAAAYAKILTTYASNFGPIAAKAIDAFVRAQKRNTQHPLIPR